MVLNGAQWCSMVFMAVGSPESRSPFWDLLGPFGVFQGFLGYSRVFWDLLGPSRVLQPLLGSFGGGTPKTRNITRSHKRLGGKKFGPFLLFYCFLYICISKSSI